MTKEDRRTLALEAMVADGRDERIAWAVRAPDVGAPPSPSLSTLALLSLQRFPNPWEVDDLFRRSLEELDLPVVSREEALRQYARDVAENIAAGALGPLEGAGRLRDLVRALDYPEGLRSWGDFDEDLYLIDFDRGELIYAEDMIIEIEPHRRSGPGRALQQPTRAATSEARARYLSLHPSWMLTWLFPPFGRNTR